MKQTNLQTQIERLIKTTGEMIVCFYEQKDWRKIAGAQRQLLHRAINETLVRIDEKLTKVELQVRVSANRGDTHAVNSWDLWRALLRQKRHALEEILDVLRTRRPQDCLPSLRQPRIDS